MRGDGTLFGLGVLVGWGFTVVGVIAFSLDSASGYRDGQIDAINGKIKYELVEQSDGSTEWERKDGE